MTDFNITFTTDVLEGDETGTGNWAGTHSSIERLFTLAEQWLHEATYNTYTNSNSMNNILYSNTIDTLKLATNAIQTTPHTTPHTSSSSNNNNKPWFFHTPIINADQNTYTTRKSTLPKGSELLPFSGTKLEISPFTPISSLSPQNEKRSEFSPLSLVGCMCHSTENLYNFYETSLARVSDDFYPKDDASQTVSS